jgi:LysM repeat protein
VWGATKLGPSRRSLDAMTVRSRAVFAAALACAPLVLLSACGTAGDAAEGADSTLEYVPATNYVLREPATTTTTTSLAPDAATPAGGTSPSEQTYTIEAGDGLFAIANRFNVEMQLICDYNGWAQCGGDKLLLPGDEILIPPNAAVASAEGEVAAEADDSIDTPDDGTTPEQAVGEGCTYTIEAGDYPGTVASKFDITYEQLQAANPSRDFSTWFLATATINIPPEGSC